jgi:hypothetical protein
MQGPAQTAATRAAILEELQRASEIELDAEVKKKEAIARRTQALHKLLLDEHCASAHDESLRQVSALLHWV